MKNSQNLYNWQQPGWPQFRYRLSEVQDLLWAFREETGRISGMLYALPEAIQMEAIVDNMIAEAIKTSEIEGEWLNRGDVMSSIRNGLGLNPVPETVRDKASQGAGELMVSVRNTCKAPLTEEILFSWHRMLFKEKREMIVGAWRAHEQPMQVVSGPMGKEKIHFEAPPSTRLALEMKGFIRWFNDTAPGGCEPLKEAPVRSAIAHLYFESIHPFEDGNGRIGRAIAEKALSQTIGRPVLLSLSEGIEKDKKVYYTKLEEAQKSSDITPWITWFASLILKAQKEAGEGISFILKKSRLFNRYGGKLNERQRKAVKRMLEEGPEGFEGGMSARKYGAITKVSKATATRDLGELAEIGLLIPKGGGRSTHYSLNL